MRCKEQAMVTTGSYAFSAFDNIWPFILAEFKWTVEFCINFNSILKYWHLQYLGDYTIFVFVLFYINSQRSHLSYILYWLCVLINSALLETPPASESYHPFIPAEIRSRDIVLLMYLVSSNWATSSVPIFLVCFLDNFVVANIFMIKNIASAHINMLQGWEVTPLGLFFQVYMNRVPTKFW